MTRTYCRFTMIGAAFLPLLLLGCKREQSYLEFIRNYEKELSSTVEKGGFRFTSLYENAEYSLAKRISSGESPESGASETSVQGIRISLHIRLPAYSGGIEDARRDPLYSSALSGTEALADRMKLFQFGMGQFFHLENSQGKKVSPLTYHFSRNPSANGACSFLFLFPDRLEDESLVPGEFEAVLRDFGLNTGTIRMKVKSETDLKLKV